MVISKCQLFDFWQCHGLDAKISSWFLASNHSTLTLIGPCNTHHNTHSHKDTHVPTTLTNELFFQNSSKR